jgi:Tfp pilus assembly protein PilN
MRAVNLLPSDTARAKRQAPQPVALAGAITGVVVVGVIGGGNLVQSVRMAHAQKTLNAAKLQLAATPLPPSTHVTPPPAAVVSQLQPREQAVSEVLAQRVAWDRILREFSLVLPPDIQVNTLTLTQPGQGGAAAAAAAGPSVGLNLSGVTYSYAGVARLVARMALIPDLTNVQLTNSSTNQGVVSFQITAGVKATPPPTSPTPQPSPTTTTTTPGATS